MATILWNALICFWWIVLALFALFLLFVLAVPCRYLVEGQYASGFHGTVELTMWPFTVRKQLPGEQFDAQGSNLDKKAKTKYKFKSKAKTKREKLKLELHLFKEKAVWESLFDLGGNLWLKMRPRTLRMEGTFGFADPYYTGMMAAVVAAIRLPGLQLQPDFSQPGFCGNIYIEGHFYAAVLIYILGKTVLTKPLRSILWKYLKKKRGGILVGY